MTLTVPAKKPLPTPMEFRNLLRAYRARHGLSQRDTAPKLGVSYVSVARWESGQRNAQPMTIRALLPILKK